jgi:hypothetical protein
MKLDTSEGTKTEQFFSQLCGNIFFRGFVFHSPKYRTQDGENEAGDVVIWLRHSLIVFEIISRKLESSPNTKSFVKKFGNKRSQLIGDFDAYSNKNNSIEMKNEFGQNMIYPSNYFDKAMFNGIVLIDAELPLENIPYLTFEKTVKNHFPIAFITKKLFSKLFAEIDTTWDLYLYLNDRKKFIEKVFYENHSYFLNLNSEYELDLIGHYKMNDNRFNLEQWKESEDKKFWLRYQNEFKEKIKLRDLDNQRTQVVDEMLEFVITENLTNEQAIEHSWEIGILTRRARAGVFADKIVDAVEKVSSGGRKDRHFAFYNQLTGCWDVFYFNYGDDQYYFEERAKFLSRMKIFVERAKADFKYSVFCFAFRKSSLIISDNVFDYCFLWQEDAKDYPIVLEKEYQEASQYFLGRTVEIPIKEFPD